MSITAFIVGASILTGTAGLGKTTKAGMDAINAKQISKDANELVEVTRDNLEKQRTACGKSLEHLGEVKLFIMNHSLRQFVEAFEQIKNIDFTGIGELDEFSIDEKEFKDLEAMVNFASSFAGGAAAGTVGGALVAFGAYSAAQALACASTGTAISALSGAAATNATLAFFGGGSLAAGGAGMAGGIAVLGGIVAGPALLVMGFITGKAAQKGLDQALINKAEAEEIAAEFQVGIKQCEIIRRRTYQFYNLLARLDSYFLPLVYDMETIIQNEGVDYRSYSDHSKHIIRSSASIAKTIKALLETTLLTDDGSLTEESATIIENTNTKLLGMQA